MWQPAGGRRGGGGVGGGVFFQAEDGIRDRSPSRGLGDVYKRQSINNLKTYFFISNNFQNNILNILATLSVMSIFIDIFKLKKNIFIGFKIPHGRGDIAKIKIDNKKLNLIDESYNSNPLSLTVSYTHLTLPTTPYV